MKSLMTAAAFIMALSGCNAAEPEQRNLVERAPECFDPAVTDKRGCPDLGQDPERKVKSITQQKDGSLLLTYTDTPPQN